MRFYSEDRQISGDVSPFQTANLTIFSPIKNDEVEIYVEFDNEKNVHFAIYCDVRIRLDVFNEDAPTRAAIRYGENEFCEYVWDGTKFSTNSASFNIKQGEYFCDLNNNVYQAKSDGKEIIVPLYGENLSNLNTNDSLLLAKLHKLDKEHNQITLNRYLDLRELKSDEVDFSILCFNE